MPKLYIRRRVRSRCCLEMFYPEFEEYPLLTCPKCGKGKFVPLDIYKAKTKK